MNFITGLFRSARKRRLTKDSDMGTFRDTLNGIIAGKDSLSDEKIASMVEQLKETTNDLPDSEGKSKLLRFLEDFKAVKTQDEGTAKTAADAVADLFEKLDAEAMKDAPEFDSTAEEVVEETAVAESEDAALEKESEEPETDVKEGVSDDDPNPAYTLEEIYQFIKKRLQEEESEATDEAPEEVQKEEPGEECGDEEGEMTADHAPISVTLDRKGPARGLAALFETAKNGGRK